MAFIYQHIVLLAILPLYWSQLLETGTSAYDSEPSLEKQLCKQLIQNYSSIGLNGRPISNMSAPITVTFGLGLIQMDLNERDKVLSTSMWSRYTWTDDYLRWSPADWGGIRSVKFSPHEIWKPDIMLYNTAETDSAQREVLATVVATGTVMWIPHQIFRSSCSIDVTNFPFDRQKCNLYFGSWTHSLQQLDLRQAFDSGIDLSTFLADYKDSCSWDIINSTAVRNTMPPDNPSMVVLGFTIHMQRKLVFATYMLTLPCVFLASLTLVVFWLPPDRPDRTSLSMSIFASFLLLLLILVEAAPPTASSVPTLGIYYCFNMVLIMVSIFLSTLVVNVGRCGDDKTRVPKWLRQITRIMARILCSHGRIKFIKDNNFTFEEETRGLLSGCDNISNGHTTGSGYNNNPQGGVSGYNQYSRDPNWHKEAENEYSRFSSSRSPNPNKQSEARSGEIQMEMQDMRGSVNAMINVIATNMIREQRLKAIKREWASVALVMDRLFFLIYIFAIGTSLILTFPKPPSDYSELPM